MTEGTREGERIAKLLARAGVASRREVERMIAEGRVAVEGKVLDTPATVLPSLRGVTVDGQPVARPERTRLFRFYKPDGLITAERDPAGRPTIYDALRNAVPAGTPRLMPVGRLDFSTEGLLLLTNDGELKRTLELPATGVPRTYRARTFGEVSQAQLEELIHGITVEGVRYGKIDANLERRTGRNQWVEMTLTEGKNREVRRVLEHLGLQVSRLIRVAYGPFTLAGLPRGGAEEVRKEELQRFFSTLRHGGASARPAPDWQGQATGEEPPTRQARPAMPRTQRKEPAPERRPIRAKPAPAAAPRSQEPVEGQARGKRAGGAGLQSRAGGQGAGGEKLVPRPVRSPEAASGQARGKRPMPGAAQSSSADQAARGEKASRPHRSREAGAPAAAGKRPARGASRSPSSGPDAENKASARPPRRPKPRRPGPASPRPSGGKGR